jgi:hypothetical protein
MSIESKNTHDYERNVAKPPEVRSSQLRNHCVDKTPINPCKRTCKKRMYRLGVRQATRLTRLSLRVALCREKRTVKTRKRRGTAVPTVQKQSPEESVVAR